MHYRTLIMARYTALLILLATGLSAIAANFEYKFNDTPLPNAIRQIMEDHPELLVNFIYNELEDYRTNATVNTDNPFEALRLSIGLNPVSVVKARNTYYIEANQRGRYKFTGQVIDPEGEPIVGATVLFLAPKDSSVVTYGTTDREGLFRIPCDRKRVIAKTTCMGYITSYRQCDSRELGTITLREKPIALKAMTVESENTRLTADKDIYLPSNRQKQFSMTGIDLLRHMAIASLVVIPGSDVVTDVFGTTCELFINYMPASKEDLTGMKMTDVRRIEVYDSPADPRFRGARKAVNFIVQEYEYGGYTKAMASETALNGFSNSSNLFSKFTYRKMTYDLYAGADNRISSHNGPAGISAQYTLTDGIVTRTERVTDSKTITNNYPISFRATFNTPQLQIRNLISFNHNATPEKSRNGQLEYNTRPDLGYVYSRTESEHTNNLSYNGSLYWTHPSNFVLDYSHAIAHAHRNNTSAYLNQALESAIDNNASENVTELRFNLFGLKAFGPRHKIKAGARINYLNDQVRYTGTTPSSDHMRTLFAAGSLDYIFSTRKFNLMVQFGDGITRMDINGDTHNETNPYGRVTLQYMLNDKNRLSAYANLAIITHGIDMRQQSIIRNDEFMYLTGNPDLKDSRQFNANLAYNLAASNRFALGAFAGYDECFSRVATLYRPYEDVLLRYFLNDGNYIRAYAGAWCNLKLLDNKLQLYANIAQNYYRTTGVYSTSYFPIPRIQLQASYYWNAFYGLLAWSNQSCRLTENSNIIICGTHTYVIEAGWGNGTWNLSLRANNIFRKSWKSETWERLTPLYNEWQTYDSPQAHANINLTVAYTIGYGKKIRHSNEIGAQSSTGSAILKP